MTVETRSTIQAATAGQEGSEPPSHTIADLASEALGLLSAIGAALVFEIGADERPAGVVDAVGKAVIATTDIALALCGLPNAPNCELGTHDPEAWKRLGDIGVKAGREPFGRTDVATMSARWEGGDVV